MTVQAMLDVLVTLMTGSLLSLILFAIVYWVYAQRRICYLEGKLWLRQVELERRKGNKE